MEIFNKKDTRISLERWFELVKPKYTYIKITPDKSIKSYNSINIAKAIKYTYKSINKRIKFEQKKLWLETNFKISYIIDIQNGGASFYFLVPLCFKAIIIEKIREIWAKATLEEIDHLEEHTKEVECYQVAYKKQDALSLNVDRRTAEPLSSILSVIEIMKETDRITILYNFLPRNNAGWQNEYQDTIKAMKEGKSLEKSKNSIKVIAQNSLSFLLGLVETLIATTGELLGAKIEEKNIGLVEALATALRENKVLSGSTSKKKDANVLDGQIAILTDGSDATRRENNAVSVAHAYRVLDEDNELMYKKVKKDFNITDYKFKNIDTNTFSVQECTNFLQIPSRLILKAFNKIGQVKVNENPVPSELQEGYIKLGNVKCKGNKQKAYLSNHKDISVLPLYVAGRQGSGKSTYFANYATYAINNSESLVHIDFIKNCESSKDIEKVVNKDKVIILDFSTEEGLQSLAYNEIKFTSNMTWFQKQELANKKSELTLELINSINESGEPLSPKMERYLTACTSIVYLDDTATLKEVIKCLQDFRYRIQILNNIPKELINELEEEISTLNELNEWSKVSKKELEEGAISEVVGTKDTKIEGILDRVQLLRRDFYLKKMFNKPATNNVNFIEAMEQGKAILVRMKQSKFKRYVKNVITTFILTKCWLACEQRGEIHKEPRRCHVMIDEISQTKTAEKYMESLLTQTRKFRMKFVLTGQYLDQLDKNTIFSLKGAGTSFMLLKGTIKEDFEYLKGELDESYEYEDLKDMEEYSSLNLIETTKGKVSFISKLPKPI